MDSKVKKTILVAVAYYLRQEKPKKRQNINWIKKYRNMNINIRSRLWGKSIAG